MADRINDLTQDQQDIVHNAMRDVGVLLMRAATALRDAGMAGFDPRDTLEASIAYMLDRGVAETLAELDLV